MKYGYLQDNLSCYTAFMSSESNQDDFISEAWRTYLTTGKSPRGIHQPWFEHPFLRPILRSLPKDPRCQICYIPFEGIGGTLARHLIGVTPSHLNPHMCNVCERFAEKFLGGVEMEVSILFADVRGSTALAEQMSSAEFSSLIRRFYETATKPLFAQNALIEKFIGDGLTAFFVPAFSGPNHANAAIEAGKGILQVTGHHRQRSPWIPVGVSVNTGRAYIGSMKIEGGRTDITILGDTVNTAARLCSQAAAGELVISQAAQKAARLRTEELELRHLFLKGKQEAMDAWVMKLK